MEEDISTRASALETEIALLQTDLAEFHRWFKANGGSGRGVKSLNSQARSLDQLISKEIPAAHCILAKIHANIQNPDQATESLDALSKELDDAAKTIENLRLALPTLMTLCEGLLGDGLHDKEVVKENQKKIDGMIRSCLNLAKEVYGDYPDSKYWDIRRELYESGQIGMLGRIGTILDIKPALLRHYLHALQSDVFHKYVIFYIPKKSGGARKITAPTKWLKKLQRAIYEKILLEVPLHDACLGFRRGMSIVTNANVHHNHQVVVNMDLKDFFPTITSPRVFGVFKSLGFYNKECWFLTLATTFEGCLPQGAPTSPSIANIAAKRLDSRLAGLAKVAGASYTRYADDISFSGDDGVELLIPMIEDIIESEEFTVADSKLRIQRKAQHQEVTGLTVNRFASVPRKLRRQIRAMEHHAEIGQPIFRGERLMDEENLRGYANYLKMVRNARKI